MTKKITLLCLLLVASVMTVNAQVTIDDLLERLELAGKTPMAEPQDLFSPSEIQMLQNHFGQDVVGNSAEAPGDVFAIDVRSVCNQAFGTFPVGGPYDFTVINATASSIFAGDMDGSGTLYGLDNGLLSLVTIDPGTGAETVVGPLTNLAPGHTVTGLAWNPTDTTMYASSTDGTFTTVYSIDLGSGTMTVIGDSGNSLGIWLAIDNDGNAFMADIGDDNLYSIDLGTGAGTLIGPLGVDISFAQDADVDPDSNTLYMAGYIGGGVNNWYSVDKGTGAVTALGTVSADCAEVAFAAIEGTLGVEDNQLSNNLTIFPNPANGSNITIETGLSGDKQVVIYDILGKQVINTVMSNDDLNISSLKSGVYMVNVVQNGQTATKKLVVR